MTLTNQFYFLQSVVQSLNIFYDLIDFNIIMNLSFIKCYDNCTFITTSLCVYDISPAGAICSCIFIPLFLRNRNQIILLYPEQNSLLVQIWR